MYVHAKPGPLARGLPLPVLNKPDAGFATAQQRALADLDRWTTRRVSAGKRRGAEIAVAIPVKNERKRIGECLRALEAQACLPGQAPFHVVLLANDCTDGTDNWLFDNMKRWSFCATVIAARLPPEQQSAGCARRLVNHVACAAAPNGVIFMTDADSCVPADWLSDYSSKLAGGLDAVAGTVSIRAQDRACFPRSLVRRVAFERAYVERLDELESLVDPLDHDPWPRHFSASGANIAARVAALRRLADFPTVHVSEDKALLRALECRDLKVRHDLSVRVTTSGRFFGRAEGGMAQALRDRIRTPDAPCDERLEPANVAWLRATVRAAWRSAYADRTWMPGKLEALLGGSCELKTLGDEALRKKTFGESWFYLEAHLQPLQRQCLVPHQLPREIQRASELLASLKEDREPQFELLELRA